MFSQLGRNVNASFSSNTRSFNHCTRITSTEPYPYVRFLMTLTLFQGHSGVGLKKNSQCTFSIELRYCMVVTYMDKIQQTIDLS